MPEQRKPSDIVVTPLPLEQELTGGRRSGNQWGLFGAVHDLDKVVLR